MPRIYNPATHRAFTFAEVVAGLVTQAVAHPGSHIDLGEGRYVRRAEDGTLEPPCLIGAWLIAAGVDPERLALFNGRAVTSGWLAFHDEDAKDFVRWAQMVQDGEGTWVSAVCRAAYEVNRNKSIAEGRITTLNAKGEYLP